MFARLRAAGLAVPALMTLAMLPALKKKVIEQKLDLKSVATASRILK